MRLVLSPSILLWSSHRSRPDTLVRPAKSTAKDEGPQPRSRSLSPPHVSLPEVGRPLPDTGRPDCRGRGGGPTMDPVARFQPRGGTRSPCRKGLDPQCIGISRRAGTDALPHQCGGLVPALDAERWASRSTILPLPSSPHCAPTMTVAGTRNQSARSSSRRMAISRVMNPGRRADNGREPRLGWPQTLLRGSSLSRVRSGPGAAHRSPLGRKSDGPA
jgi:hypothetical protein